MFFSLKWKFTCLLMLVSAAIVITYVLFARDIFESDKISYVFEAQHAEVEQLAKNFDETVARALSDAVLLATQYDQSAHALSLGLQKYFQSQPALESVAVLRTSTSPGFDVAHRGPLPVVSTSSEQAGTMTYVAGTFFKAVIEARIGGESRIVAVIFQVPPLKAASEFEHLFAAIGQKNILFEGDSSASRLIEGILASPKNSSGDGTFLEQIGGARYLVSFAQTRDAKVRIYSVVLADHVLDALRTLYQKSVYFVLIGLLLTFCISLILSGQLTGDLRRLTAVASELARGNFDVVPNIRSRDEIGVFAEAFRRMTSEIKKLFHETLEKDRMERELKTAALVQQNLFPVNDQTQVGEYDLAGLYRTSTECGGDWWYHYQVGGYLYLVIADATGHGTPAALVTAAAKSIFSYIETTPHTLTDLARIFDSAVFASAKKTVFMTAVLAKLDLRTHELEVISAAHEPLFHFRRQANTTELAFVDRSFPVHPRIGEGYQGNWLSEKFRIQPGELIVFYTDGLLALAKSPSGTQIGERRIIKKMASALGKAATAKQAAEFLYKYFFEMSSPVQLEDDVTLAVLRRNVK